MTVREPVTTEEKLDAILVQTRLTNGRVKALEDDVYGDERRHHPGLIEDFGEIKGYVLDTRAIVRSLRWLIPTSIAAVAGGVGVITALT